MAGTNPAADIEHGAVDTAPTTDGDNANKSVSWIDVSEDNDITN